MRITFDTDNDAYQEEDGNLLLLDAVADTIDVVARKVREGMQAGSIYDVNGNRVGSWSL